VNNIEIFFVLQKKKMFNLGQIVLVIGNSFFLVIRPNLK